VRTPFAVPDALQTNSEVSLIQGIPALPYGRSITRNARTSVPTYLIERYRPGVTSELLLDGLKRGRRMMEQMSVEGTRIRDISYTLIPGKEVVFSSVCGTLGRRGPSAQRARRYPG
jgi:hypothetical protein